MTDQNKPKLDEQIFAKLLEAAYVLQEHNREMREIEESLEMHTEFLRQQEAEAQTALQKSAQRADQRPRNTADYTLTLAEIVEAQHQIQIRHLQSDQAMDVVADRIARITNASGAGVAIQDGKLVRYRAGAGTAALPVGTGVPLDTAICAICVRTGQVLRTPDVDTEFLFDPELCRQRGIYSLVAVPVYHDGNIVGALELYFDRVQGFVEQDIHTCQLMAGLVTEAIGRSSQSALKNSMAEELSSMLATIEKLQPTLAAGEPEQNLVAVNQIPRAPAEEAPPCWKCGSKVGAEDQFCGKCGAPRLGERDRSSVQKLTSTWSVPSASSGAPNGPADRTAPRMLSTSEAPPASPAKQEIAPRAGAGSSPTEETETWPPASTVAAINERMLEEVEPDGLRSDEAAIEKSPSALTKATPSDATWSSAAKARDFLDGLAQSRSSSALVRFWHVRRGHIYLAVALIAVLMVIWWGVMSSHSVGATGATSVSTNGSRRKAATDADLSTWDKILINLGVAEAPSQAPELKGNPDTQVWIDLHTALYYCPGSDLYGKTPNGRFTSQREAQLDQFESASRRACD